MLEWIGPDLVPGDELWIAMPGEGLAAGLLELEGSLATVVERLGLPLELVLHAPAQRVTLEIERAAGIASGAGLAAIGEHLVGGRLRCRVRSTGSPRAELEVLARDATFTAAGVDEPLAEALRGGASAGIEEVALHDEAVLLGRSPDLTTLLSDRLVRDFTPFDYQRAVVRAVLGRFRGRAILADEVGLGKTVEAGMALLEYQARRLVRRCLVLTPPSLVGQWRAELAGRFGLRAITPEEPAFGDAGAQAWDRFPLILASLALAKREPHRARIIASRFDMVIVDEAHHLRNERSAAYRLVADVPRRFLLLLTATPVQNDLMELHSLVTLLAPGQLDTRARFSRRFVGPDGPRAVEELRARLKDVMIRNRRSECGVELPPRRATSIRIEPSSAERELYAAVTAAVRQARAGPGDRAGERPSSMLLRHLQQEVGSSPRALVATLTSRQDHPLLGPLHERARAIAESSKVAVLERLVGEAGGERVLVFTQHRATQDEIALSLRAAGHRVNVHHGGMSRIEKDAAVESFREGGGVLVATESGGEGRNLQFCNRMVNFDLPWNPMRIEQRVGRIHRIGQSRPVEIHNLVMRGTLEDELFRVLEAKINLFELVVGELDMILGELEEEGRFEERVFDLWAGAADDATAVRGLEELGDELARGKQSYAAQRRLAETVLGDALAETGGAAARVDGGSGEAGEGGEDS